MAAEHENQIGEEAGYAAAQPEAHSFLHIRCLEASLSPHPRARIERALKQLSSCLREEPTIPADPDNLDRPWGAALLEDAAVQLPKKHCAFKGCGWTGHSDSEQLEHLASAHKEAVD